MSASPLIICGEHGGFQAEPLPSGEESPALPGEIHKVSGSHPSESSRTWAAFLGVGKQRTSSHCPGLWEILHPSRFALDRTSTLIYLAVTFFFILGSGTLYSLQLIQHALK